MQGDVLCRGEVWAQRQFLVDYADPQRTGVVRILKPDSFTVDKDFAGVWLKLAGENIDQSALAGAVFSQERMDLAGVEDEVHPIQRQRAAEAFTDAAREDDRVNAHLFSWRVELSISKG